MADNKKPFDLQGVLSSIKTLLNPTGEVPDPDPQDALGVKLSQLSTLTRQLQEEFEEQADRLRKIHRLSNDVYALLEALRSGGSEDSDAKSTKPESQSDKKSGGDESSKDD